MRRARARRMAGRPPLPGPGERELVPGTIGTANALELEGVARA